MFHEGLLDRTLRSIKKLIPVSVFNFLAPIYHALLAWAGALLYGFPSRSIKVIGVTGTKGKSTVVYLITELLEGAGHPVAMIGSLGYKIKDKEWPNTLKMTMPGRFKLQRFLRRAVSAGCKYVVLEVTSEGIKQKRHLGIDFDCAVLTNVHKEHLEAHGSFENYYRAKLQLFKKAGVHVLNADDPNVTLFADLPAQKKITYGIQRGDLRAGDVHVKADSAEFQVYGTHFAVHLGGRFNVYNCLAALAAAAMYGVDLPTAKPILEKISGVKGRMEFVQKEPFAVVVDYAHTPDSLQAVYKTLKDEVRGRLICVLGAAGGGRDKWKRPEFGRIAGQYCDSIILTDEDPYDEDPESIIEQIASGIPEDKSRDPVMTILDRKDAIIKALTEAREGDTVVITGKGSEISMALAGGKKLPWSDRGVVQEVLRR